MLNQLTIETLSHHFKNNFEMTNYIIEVAQRLINSGKDVAPRALLEEIARHPDKYDLEKLKKEVEKFKERQDETT
jgi:hypothetical protein